MSRRKGELTPAGVDRGWPHQIAILSELMRGVETQAVVEEFCKKLLRAPRGHFVQHDDKHYTVHCFALKEHAQAFMDRFGGEWFDPRERGRGANWSKWDKGKFAGK